MPSVLAATADPDLADDVVRLGAATGVPVTVADSLTTALGLWGTADLVVVGVDLLNDVATTNPGRRPGVVAVRRREPWSAPDESTDFWRAAVAVGAEHVWELPGDERPLVDRLADVAEPRGAGGPLVALIGGTGGAGASSLAVELARRRSTDTLLVDVDPLGGGLDLALDAEHRPGLRWPDLAATRGRVPPSALRAALPRVGEVSVVSHGRPAPPGNPLEPIGSAALAAVLDAGRRGFARTVVDLARGTSAPHEVVGPRATCLVVVVVGQVRAVAAAAALVGSLTGSYAQIVGVTRRPQRTDIDDDAVSAALGIPIIAAIGPTSRRRIRRPNAVDAVLDVLGPAAGRQP